jgi:hypothetical protein
MIPTIESSETRSSLVQLRDDMIPRRLRAESEDLIRMKLRGVYGDVLANTYLQLLIEICITQMSMLNTT